MNFKFTLAYNGSNFKGSQRQIKDKTIENEILKVFSKLGIEENILMSGRTDKGVHALAQVFSADIPIVLADEKVLKKVLNHSLDPALRITKVEKCSKDFHARFSAKTRTYRYLVKSCPLNAFEGDFFAYFPNINEKLIKQAIKLFVGEHDFEYFHKLGSEKTNFIRKVYFARFYKHKDFYVFSFKANSYLRSQVRLIVGALFALNEGKINIKDIEKQLEKKQKIHFRLAIPNGLYLAKIGY